VGLRLIGKDIGENVGSAGRDCHLKNTTLWRGQNDGKLSFVDDPRYWPGCVIRRTSRRARSLAEWWRSRMERPTVDRYTTLRTGCTAQTEMNACFRRAVPSLASSGILDGALDYLCVDCGAQPQRLPGITTLYHHQVESRVFALAGPYYFGSSCSRAIAIGPKSSDCRCTIRDP